MLAVVPPTVDTIQLAGIFIPAVVAILLAVYANRRAARRDAALLALQADSRARELAEQSRLQAELALAQAKAQAEALKQILGGIELKVDGRLETALEKIDRLELILAKLTGTEAPPPVAGQNLPVAAPSPVVGLPDAGATVVTTVIEGLPATVTKTTVVEGPTETGA